ncbi:oncostatin-M-specific receptor subunit beta isoform X3 [Mesocricetus auratus]|uniref:Oncostatin-M-specific receptor subunit beta isoform X3 n=1 Tax=Mesocricetus auratus TaxID=10036 RepID=A0ABM2YFF7_MESAU|nr:oncostatin-M-specific receptor subunit beta isoform X3 [Mesocricetus auratus]
MAFSAVLHPAFLLVVLPLKASLSEVLGEPFQLIPEILTVSIQSKLQQVNLQWTVPNLTHQELKMGFQIEISRMNASNIIWVEDYSTTVKRNQVLHWNWKSEIPLECVTHFIRIRAMVDDANYPPQNSWSNWSSWKEVSVQVSVAPNTLLIFPKSKLLEEGSNVTICLLYGQYLYNVSCMLQKEPIHGEQLDSHVSLIKLNNVVFHSHSGTNIYCQAMNATKTPFGTVLFVSKVLEEPKNFSCETQDFKTLKCSWEPGVDTALTWSQQDSQNYTLYESFSGRSELSDHRNSHNWKITEESQETYNFTLTTENNLRKRSVNIIFNLTHRVHLKAPHDVTLETVDAKKANMTWKMHSRGDNYILLCQVELQHETEVIHECNVSVHMSASYLFSDLEPDTEYKARVRCADANHFWKWSDWAQKAFSTPEAAPSQALDVWRQVRSENGSHVVTLFWKPLLKSQANGKIVSYNIVVENQDRPSEAEHYSVQAPALGTQLSLDMCSYKIHITANNSMGVSPESVMALSNDSGHASYRVNKVEAISHLKPRLTLMSLLTELQKNPGIVNPQSPAMKRYTCGQKANGVDMLRSHTLQQCYPSVLAAKEEVHEKRIKGTKDGFHISWEPLSGDALGYVVDWCAHSRDQHCDLKWKNLGPNTTSTNITSDAFKPGVRYNFRIFEKSVQQNAQLLEKQTGYTQELAHMLLKIILPMTLCVLLIVIACYWKSQWVKEKCYPDIPNPYKSSILSLIKSKKNPHLIMNVKDCIPDVLEVINKVEGPKTQCIVSGKPHNEDVSIKPPSSVPTEDGSSGPVPFMFFENFTYDQSAFDSGSHGLNPGPLKDTPGQLGLLTPPDKLLNVLEKDYMKSLAESPTEETSLIYVSQLASPMCGDKDSLVTNSPKPVHCSGYKRQMAVPGRLPSLALSESNSLTSMILLGQGEQ